MFTKLYDMFAIITHNCIIISPYLKSISLFSRSFFRKFFPYVIKSRLWRPAKGIYFLIKRTISDSRTKRRRFGSALHGAHLPLASDHNSLDSFQTWTIVILTCFGISLLASIYCTVIFLMSIFTKCVCIKKGWLLIRFLFLKPKFRK